MTEIMQAGMFRITRDGQKLDFRIKNIPYPAASFFMELYRYRNGTYLSEAQIRKLDEVDHERSNEQFWTGERSEYLSNRDARFAIWDELRASSSDVINLTLENPNDAELPNLMKKAILSDRKEMDTATYYMSGGDKMWSKTAAGKPLNEYTREEIEAAMPDVSTEAGKFLYKKCRYLVFNDGHAEYTFEKFMSENGDAIYEQFKNKIDAESAYNVMESFGNLAEYCTKLASDGRKKFVRKAIRQECERLIKGGK